MRRLRDEKLWEERGQHVHVYMSWRALTGEGGQVSRSRMTLLCCYCCCWRSCASAQLSLPHAAVGDGMLPAHSFDLRGGRGRGRTRNLCERVAFFPARFNLTSYAGCALPSELICPSAEICATTRWFLSDERARQCLPWPGTFRRTLSVESLSYAGVVRKKRHAFQNIKSLFEITKLFRIAKTQNG